jgi:hypothetical protein
MPLIERDRLNGVRFELGDFFFVIHDASTTLRGVLRVIRRGAALAASLRMQLRMRRPKE